MFDDVRTWIEVEKSALKNNYNEFRKLIIPTCKLMAVCKSNAYGHGLVDFTEAMVELGADWLGVDSMTEALRLRKEGIKLPILVLGYTLPSLYEEAAKQNVSLTISAFEQLENLLKIKNSEPARPAGGLKIHLKIDSGMHRQGFQLDEIEKAAKFIKEKLSDIEVEGVYTHFAAAKNPAFPADTNMQIEQFEKAFEIVQSAGFKPLKHAAATSGTIVFPKSHYDMVRIGIGLYGLWPSLETKEAFRHKINLIPALTWKTIISEIKSIKADEGVGYDLTESLDRDGKIAILPIGYWHGYRRDLSSIGRVSINGKIAKVLGRVSMDMIVVDVSDIDCKVGDKVIVLGGMILAEYLAALSDTSWYETITQINPLIRRTYN